MRIEQGAGRFCRGLSPGPLALFAEMGWMSVMGAWHGVVSVSTPADMALRRCAGRVPRGRIGFIHWVTRGKIRLEFLASVCDSACTGGDSLYCDTVWSCSKRLAKHSTLDLLPHEL